MYVADEEELAIGGVRFRTFDLGGHVQARRVWRDYFPSVDAIVFVVDAADARRFDEARAELSALLADEALAGVPVLVLGNKVDLDGAVSEDELRYQLGLGPDLGPPDRPRKLVMCSIARRFGYGDGFHWLVGAIRTGGAAPRTPLSSG